MTTCCRKVKPHDPNLIFGPESDCESYDFIVKEGKPITVRAYNLEDHEAVCVDTVVYDHCTDAEFCAPVHVTCGDSCGPLCLTRCQNIIYLDVPGRYRFKTNAIPGAIRVVAEKNTTGACTSRI